ncbi:Hypothetical predicted protein [Cloeon dipterum]|uniref:Uncharacterized protein n=1 Tax=Cloeon dipterum TaxID=197152 RepID=A0A8S1BQL7_9INSE|nr:Hypothetical predicted protein [Cloeon dipterum]
MENMVKTVEQFFDDNTTVVYALLAVTALLNVLNFVQLIVMHLSVKREEKKMASRPMELQGSAQQEAVEEENYMYGQIGAKPRVEQEENIMYGKVGTEKNGYATQPKIETRLRAPGIIEQEENCMYGVITPDIRPATIIAEQEEENCIIVQLEGERYYAHFKNLYNCGT